MKFCAGFRKASLQCSNSIMCIIYKQNTLGFIRETCHAEEENIILWHCRHETAAHAVDAITSMDDCREADEVSECCSEATVV